MLSFISKCCLRMFCYHSKSKTTVFMFSFIAIESFYLAKEGKRLRLVTSLSIFTFNCFFGAKD